MFDIQRLSIQNTFPQVIQNFMAVEKTLTQKVPKLLRHLIKLRVSQINGCAFCVDMHIREALVDGESQKRLDRLVVWRAVPDFDQAEKAALEWAEALTTLEKHPNLDPVFEALSKHYQRDEIDAMTLVVIMINNWNRMQIAHHQN